MDAEGERLFDEGDYEGAERRFREVLELAPENPGHLLRLASAQWHIGKKGDALQNARAAASQDSKHKEDALMLVAFCLRSLKRYREAARTFLDLSERFPGSPNRRTAIICAGLAFEEAESFSEAEEAYSILAASGDGEAIFRIGLSREFRGDKKGAEEAYERYLASAERGDEAAKVLFRLATLDFRQGRFARAAERFTECAGISNGSFLAEMAGKMAERAKTRETSTRTLLSGYDPRS